MPSSSKKTPTPTPKRSRQPTSPSTNLWDASCTKLTEKIQENSAFWYEVAATKSKNASNTSLPLAFQTLLDTIKRHRCPKTGSLDPVKHLNLWNQLQLHGKALYDHAMKEFTSSKAKGTFPTPPISSSYTLSAGKQSSDEKYLATLRKSGTLADRVAALTLTIQSAPFFSIPSIVQLMGMARKHARREAAMAIRSLQDLFLQTFLPANRPLLFFHQQCLLNVTIPSLLVWYYENQLKTVFAHYISILSNGMNDSILTFQKSCILANHNLLSNRPEQERVLLAMLVNKLGDANGKIVTLIHALLRQLLEQHPHMKHVVSQEAEQLIRKKTNENEAQARVQLQALVFLTQLRFQRSSAQDAALASHLITLYFGIFTDAIRQPENARNKLKNALDRKVLSVLLIGVNRAFPYANSCQFEKELTALFYIVHHAHAFHTSVQALMLIYQVLDATQSMSDRFYIALYAKLWDPKLRKTAKHTFFLNLVFRALQSDPATTRSATIVKRLLQVALLMPPAFICAVLFLLSELCAKKPILRLLWSEMEINPSDDLKTDGNGFEEEDPLPKDVDDIDEEARAQKVLTELFGAKTTTPSVTFIETYDFQKRNPLFAAGDRSCAWEMTQFQRHVHPSVRHFTQQLLSPCGSIQYSGDPLVDFTLSSFLDKFVSKKPQKRKENPMQHSTPVVCPLGIETPMIDASDQFFYKFFQLKEERHPYRSKSEMDANSDVSEEAFAMELAEGLLEEEANFDDEDVDMSDWSGHESEDENNDDRKVKEKRKSPFVCAEDFIRQRKKSKK